MERNNLFLLLDVFQVTNSTLDRHILQGTSGFMSILEVDSKIGATSLARLRIVIGFLAVMNFAHCVDNLKLK